MYPKGNDSDQLYCRVLMVAVTGGVKLWRLCVHQLHQYFLSVCIYAIEWDMLKVPETVMSLGLLSLESFGTAMRI